MIPVDIITALVIVFLAEFLDKTQILVVLLASKFDGTKVFIGSSAALITVALLSCLIGVAMIRCLPRNLISIIMGLTLIIVGTFFMLKSEEIDAILDSSGNKNAYLYSFTAVFLAELGDKTQFAVITLAVTCNNPFQVIIGASIAFISITFLGVLFGNRIKVLAESKGQYVSLAVSVLFILLGLLFIIPILL